MDDNCRITDCDGNNITSCVVCGMEISPHNFEEVETLYGDTYVVQILECRDCGTPSFGWFRRGD